MRSRAGKPVAATLILVAAILISSTLGLPSGPAVWLVGLTLALAAVFVLARNRGGATGFLCDRCRYDDQRYCRRPERPNATRCDDYRPR